MSVAVQQQIADRVTRIERHCGDCSDTKNKASIELTSEIHLVYENWITKVGQLVLGKNIEHDV